MLGFGVTQSTVSKYMARSKTPPSQSWKTFLQKRRAGDRRHWSMRSSDADLWSLVCVPGSRSGPATAAVVRDTATSDSPSGWLGKSPRHFPGTWRQPTWCATTIASTATPRPPNLSWVPIAEWLRWTTDRHIAPRVPGSSGDLQRDAPAANSYRLCGVLQSSAHAHGITERCALASSSPTLWRHLRHSDPGWTAPPIRPDI